MDVCYLISRSIPSLASSAGVLAAGIVGHLPVLWFLKATNFYRPVVAGHPKFSMWIGVLERIIVAALVLVDEFEASVFIFATKAGVMTLRFDAEDRRRELVEYVLVGTLASFAVAMAFGFTTRWFVRLVTS